MRGGHKGWSTRRAGVWGPCGVMEVEGCTGGHDKRHVSHWETSKLEGEQRLERWGGRGGEGVEGRPLPPGVAFIFSPAVGLPQTRPPPPHPPSSLDHVKRRVLGTSPPPRHR